MNIECSREVFPSAAAARKAIEKLRKRGKTLRGSGLQPFTCKDCGKFHIGGESIAYKQGKR